jgi:hypothetical protein
MGKGPLNPNARKALDEMKIEIANELGLPDTLSNDNPIDNIFTAGPVGGVMTRKLVEMGEQQLIDRE